MGSIILPKEIDKIEEWVNDAIDDGAKLLYGVKRISVSCYKPSVLFNPTANVRVSTQEIFGSVLCIYSFSDRNMAIEIANSLTVHFQASVFTKDIDVAFDTANKLEVTVVMVNDHTAFGVDWMPFGGRDYSGISQGGIQYSMHEMTREKMIDFKRAIL